MWKCYSVVDFNFTILLSHFCLKEKKSKRVKENRFGPKEIKQSRPKQTLESSPKPAAQVAIQTMPYKGVRSEPSVQANPTAQDPFQRPVFKPDPITSLTQPPT